MKRTVSNASVETTRYVGQKTGNARERVIATVCGMTTEGEMIRPSFDFRFGFGAKRDRIDRICRIDGISF